MEQPKHVYLIDDDPDDRYLVCEAFTLVRPQDNIIEAINGHHFFEILDVNKVSVPSLIILDVNMPGMNGLETLKRIRSLILISSIPVVMYSTSESPSLIEQAYQAGASTFIVKPNSFEGLLEMWGAVTSKYL